MPILFLRDIHLTFGGTPLFEGAELSVDTGDRLALVGRNGSGKSTLLKIAAGLIQSDTGERFLQPGVTLRYLPQEPDLTGFATTLDFVVAGLGPVDGRHRAEASVGAAWPDRRRGRRRSFRAARPGAARSPARWRPSRISFCWMSRPTTSTCRPSSGWKRSLGAFARRSC